MWYLVSEWLGLYFVTPNDPTYHFIQFVGCLDLNSRSRLSIIWSAVVWQVWNAMNGRIFREEGFDVVFVFELARIKSWEWLMAKNSHFIHVTYEWCMEPSICLTHM